MKSPEWFLNVVPSGLKCDRVRLSQLALVTQSPAINFDFWFKDTKKNKKHFPK